MTDANAVEENLDMFIGQFGKIADDFGMAKSFLSAAIGHAAAKMDDRTPLRDVLLEAADRVENGKLARSPHRRPVTWMPKSGEPAATQFAIGKIAATLAKLHAAYPAADRAAFKAAALRAGLIMISWHDPTLAAAAIRAFADALKHIRTAGHQ